MRALREENPGPGPLVTGRRILQWDPREAVPEEECLNRAILCKCWLAFLQNRTVRFNDLEISVDVAKEMLTAAGVDLSFEIEGMSDQATELRRVHGWRAAGAIP